MPTLDWIGKQAVVNHDKDVPFRLLKHDPKLSVGDSQNLLIKGDNLEALKALMPYYIGKVKCVYIDPPYNTGREEWRYNDAVNSSEIREWIDKVVGKQGDDLSRHDKWLCMMYPRLKLLRELLSEKGIIFVSIDENEHHNLRWVLNEVFGEKSFAGEFVWNTRHSQQQGLIASYHEYILVYTKGDASDFPNFTWDDGGTIEAGALKKISKANPASNFKFPAGVRCTAKNGSTFNGIWGGEEKVELIDGKFAVENGKTKYAMTLRAGWTNKRQMERYFRGEDVKDSKGQKIKEFFFISSGKLKIIKEKSRITPSSVLDQFGTTSQSTTYLQELMQGNVFDRPKPVAMIQYLIKLCSPKNSDDIILDSFAGSGTTGEAVLSLNAEDHGHRKFLLVEMENNIAEKVTAKRINKVIDRTGGGFQFLRLDSTLFDKDGKLSEPVTYLDLARYVFFTETQRDLDEKKVKKPYIGTCGETEYFLFFTERGKNTFKREQLKQVSKDNVGTAKVVYADRCLLSEETLQKHNVVFKQIPYQVKLY